jgi:hypothetical protein
VVVVVVVVVAVAAAAAAAAAVVVVLLQFHKHLDILLQNLKDLLVMLASSGMTFMPDFMLISHLINKVVE